MKLLILAMICCSLFSCSTFAFEHHTTSSQTLSVAILQVESKLNHSIDNAIVSLDPIFTINPELSEYLDSKIQDFKIILLDQIKKATYSIINRGANSNQLLKIWREIVIINLKKLARTISFPYFQSTLKLKKYPLEFIKNEALKYLPKFEKSHVTSLTHGLEKRSLIYNVSRDIAIILSGIITVLASWIIFTLYGLSFMIGEVLRFVSGRIGSL